MTKKNLQVTKSELKEILSGSADYLKPMIREVLQELLEAEVAEHLGAGTYERTEDRRGYRSGYYTRTLLTRVGKLELRVPQTRDGKFSTEIFERYQRSEKALVSTLVEMYVQGVSTRKVRKVTEELCGHGVSASTVSRMNKQLDKELKRFMERSLSDQEHPYLILDARYEKVRENGVIVSRAVLVALGINWDGRREVLAVELANRESLTSWKDFLIGLKKRGLKGTQLVISDAHEGLRQAVVEALPSAIWQRCYVHFLRNALGYLSRKADKDCIIELRWLYDRRDREEARKDLGAWLAKWEGHYPKVCNWVEENIEQTLSYYDYPQAHHKHLRSTNMLERLNQEIKRRTHVVRIFPNAESCLRLVRALAVETHELWIEQHRYLNMELLKEHQKLRLESKSETAA